MPDFIRLGDLKVGDRFCLPPGEPTLMLTDIPAADQLFWCVDVNTGKGVRLHVSDPVQKKVPLLTVFDELTHLTDEQYAAVVNGFKKEWDGMGEPPLEDHELAVLQTIADEVTYLQQAAPEAKVFEAFASLSMFESFCESNGGARAVFAQAVDKLDRWGLLERPKQVTTLAPYLRLGQAAVKLENLKIHHLLF